MDRDVCVIFVFVFLGVVLEERGVVNWYLRCDEFSLYGGFNKVLFFGFVFL